jgi:hypothetical protein
MREKIIRGFDATLSLSVTHLTNTVQLITTVPDRVKLKLTHFGNYVADITAWTNIQWDILQNSGLDPLLSGIKDQIGTQYFPRELGYQPVYAGGTKLEIKLTNNHATIDYGVGVTVKGYFFVEQ